MVHGVDSKDRQAGNMKEKAGSNQTQWFSPTLFWVHCLLQILGKELVVIERHLIPHDVKGGSGEFIGQSGVGFGITAP